MSRLTADALATLSTAAEQGPGRPSQSPSRASAGSPRSLLDDWEQWPENHPKFDPFFDNARPVRAEFCECEEPGCEYCSETRQVLHVSEYTADGQSVIDEKFNTKQLHEHLRELEQLDKSDARTPNRPSGRLFFACSNHAEIGLRYKYMRHFFAYCRIPPRFVLTRSDSDCLPVFQAAYEPTSGRNSPPDPQRGTLHMYLQSFSFVLAPNILANSEYYSTEFEPRLRVWVEGVGFAVLSPSLYLRYDESSRETVAYLADAARTFHCFRNLFSTGVREAKQDPFLLVAISLQHRVADIHEWVSAKRFRMRTVIDRFEGMTSLDSDNTVLFSLFFSLTGDGPGHARMQHEVSGILRALGAIEAEHQLFLQRDGSAEGGTAGTIRLRFQQQRAHLLELQSSLSELVKCVEIVKDLTMGHAQLLNGLDMTKMTRDSQTQAVATEALARDARRDSEIMKRDSATMKTITVVTLVYLPATFVSTLLSMGLFDFDVGNDRDGRLRIAREGWIFLAISLPLTILTLGLAFLWKQFKERQWEREALQAQHNQEKPTAGSGEGARRRGYPPAGHGASRNGEPALRGKGLLATFRGLRQRSALQKDSEMGKAMEDEGQ